MTFHRIEEVAVPSLIFQSEPHCGQCDIWLGGRVSGGIDFYTFYFAFLLSKAHFVCLGACCLFHFEKLSSVFVKSQNIVIHILIHTIQIIFSSQKLYPFLHPFFFGGFTFPAN